jgi:hypothetical protein
MLDKTRLHRSMRFCIEQKMVSFVFCCSCEFATVVLCCFVYRVGFRRLEVRCQDSGRVSGLPESRNCGTTEQTPKTGARVWTLDDLKKYVFVAGRTNRYLLFSMSWIEFYSFSCCE